MKNIKNNKIFGNFQIESKSNRLYYWNVFCLECGYKFTIRKDSFKTLLNKKCPQCIENYYFIDKALFNTKKIITTPFKRLTQSEKKIILQSDDILGKKLDLLTVIGIHGKKFICKCDCGNIQEYSKDDLRNKISCGCAKKFRKLKYFNLEGKIFNSWKVIKQIPSKKDPMWLCECLKCGDFFNVNQYNLVSGVTKSCLKCSLKGKSKPKEYIIKYFLGKNHHSYIKDRSKVIGTQEWFDKRVEKFYFLEENKTSEKNSFLYILKQKNTIKIGKTKESALKGRFNALEKSFGKFIVNSLYKGSERFIFALEHNCHRKFKNFRLKRKKEGEWNGHTEWFEDKCLSQVQSYLGDFCG